MGGALAGLAVFPTLYPERHGLAVLLEPDLSAHEWFDGRLLRHARTTRTHLVVAVLLGLAQAVLVVAQAYLLATVLAAAFADGDPFGGLATPLVTLGLVVAGRATLAWAAEAAAHRTSAAVKSELRRQLLHHVVRLGPRWLTGQRTGELTTLVTRGIDALDGYFSRYLPQLVLGAVVPLSVVAVLLAADWTSAVYVGGTLVAIPVLLVVVGKAAKRRVDRQWSSLQALAHHFLDILSGLGTLKSFGRSRAQVAIIGRLADQQRQASLSTMRVAFLSSLALELLAALSVAMVAVALAGRLLDGSLDLRSAFLVLLLAPEAYAPLRQAAVHYHASAEGLGAAAEVFEVLEEPGPHDGAERDRAVAMPDPRTAPIRLDDVTVLGADRSSPLLDGLSMELTPGQVTGLVARSGAGKSTVLALLLRFVSPDSGRVLVGADDLTTLDPERWRGQVGWLPQDPVLFAGTVADNIALRDPDADAAAVEQAARMAAVDVPLTLEVGERGTGLSAGQRRRVALARALLRDAPLLLLDEPTEGVDPETEAALVARLPRVLAGRTTVLVTHRPGLLRLCHHVVRLDRWEVPA